MSAWNNIFIPIADALAMALQVSLAQIGLDASYNTLILLCCTAAFFLTAAFYGFKSWRLTRYGMVALGEVIQIKRDLNFIKTAVIVFFDHNGEFHEFKSELAIDADTDTVGKTIEVLYDPARPLRAVEAHKVKRIHLTTSVFTAFAVLSLFAMFNS